MSPNLLSFSNHYCGLTENLELAENYKTEFLNLPLDKTMKKIIYLNVCLVLGVKIMKLTKKLLNSF